MRGDVKTQRVWTVRAEAIALDAGTQVLTALPWIALTGHSPVDLHRALLLGTGWGTTLR
jgi:hypothetical protein